MGAFITIEGGEGAGKTTVISELAAFVRGKGLEVITTREPGATDIGKEIRAIVLNPEHKNLTRICELMLYAADRAQHVAEVIKPALSRGAVVISDRYIHSTLAYQGYGRGIPQDILVTLNNLATEELKPDLVLLLDIDPEEGLSRVRKRIAQKAGTKTTDVAPEWNRFEDQELEFHRKLRQGFLELAKDPAEHFAVIDASQSVEKVTAQALELAAMLLKSKQV